MAGQLDEQVELRPGQRDVAAVAFGRPAADVDRDRAEVESVAFLGEPARPPKRGPDAGDELGDLERLLDVVVGARLEADHDIDRVGAGGEHDDRDRRRPADRAADLEAVHARQHDVEQDEVERLGGEPLEAFAPVGRGRDGEARVAQADRRHLADRRVILDEQDPGVHGFPRAPATRPVPAAVCQSAASPIGCPISRRGGATGARRAGNVGRSGRY